MKKLNEHFIRAVIGDGVCSYVADSVNSQESDNFANVMLSKVGKIFRAANEQEFELVSEMFLATTVTAYYSINSLIKGNRTQEQLLLLIAVARIQIQSTVHCFPVP